MHAKRHERKYILPFLGSNEYTHELAKDYDDLLAGTKIRIIRTENINDRLHAHVQSEYNDSIVIIPVSRIEKPFTPNNKGFSYENEFYERMKSHGMVPDYFTPAGCGNQADIVLLKKTKVEDFEIHGELKCGINATFGQITIRHDEEKLWHITNNTREFRPEFAKQVELAGLIDHMNERYADPYNVEKTDTGKAKPIYVSHDNLKPIDSYLTDHSADFIQIESMGTYKVGDDDITGANLPSLDGEGKWVIREKHPNPLARNIEFKPAGKKKMTESHIDLDRDIDLLNFKTSLGYTT